MSEAARSRVINIKHVRGCSIGSSKIHHIDAEFWTKKSFATSLKLGHADCSGVQIGHKIGLKLFNVRPAKFLQVAM